MQRAGNERDVTADAVILEIYVAGGREVMGARNTRSDNSSDAVAQVG